MIKVKKDLIEMALLTASNLGLWFGEREIFSGVNFSLQDGARAGLVGVNGCGKTSLFRLITGELHPEEGEITTGKFTKIGYMEQITLSSTASLYDDVLSVFAPLTRMEREIAALSDEMNRTHDIELIEKHHALTERFHGEGGLTYPARTRSALIGLGFSDEQIAAPANILSGGQQSKAKLCKLLLSGANLLLLDEPTNHLDIAASRWLEEFMLSFSGGYIVISHDRYFLDRVTNQTIEMQNRRVTAYPGSYSRYIRLRDERRESKIRQNENTQREIKRIEGIIAQQKRFNQERNYITIASKQKQIDRLKEDLFDIDRLPSEVKFRFSTDVPVTNDILKADRLALSYGTNEVFRDVSLILHKGERVFLLGANGCGKTSLLKVLASKIPGGRGSFGCGPGVTLGYFEQSMTSLRQEKTALNEIWDRFPKLTETQVRSALARFLFKGDAVYARVGQLSGGEKARLALLSLMLSGANCLLLDEPTNHLDIASREALEQALAEYEGTMLIVSHDRYFINKLADRVYHMENGGLTPYNGDYDAFLRARAELPAADTTASAKPRTDTALQYHQKKAADSAKRRAGGEIKRLEARISGLEEELLALEDEMTRPDVAADYARILELTTALDALRAEEDGIYARLEELYEVVGD